MSPFPEAAAQQLLLLCNKIFSLCNYFNCFLISSNHSAASAAFKSVINSNVKIFSHTLKVSLSVDNKINLFTNSWNFWRFSRVGIFQVVSNPLIKFSLIVNFELNEKIIENSKLNMRGQK